MQNMKRFSIIIVMFLTALFSNLCYAQEKEISMQAILATSKYAGACGILDALIKFQESTSMDGGYAFVTEFWEYEATRLGMTVKQLSDRCDLAITTYNKLFNASGILDAE